MKKIVEKVQKLNFKLAFRFGKIWKIINARCGRRRFLRFWSTWSGVGHPEMPPSCPELNSDDFPFFRNLSSSSGTRDSFFGSCYKKSSSSSSRLIKRNENCWQPPAQCPVVDKEQKANTKRQKHKYKVKYKDKDNVKYTNTLWPIIIFNVVKSDNRIIFKFLKMRVAAGPFFGVFKALRVGWAFQKWTHRVGN